MNKTVINLLIESIVGPPKSVRRTPGFYEFRASLQRVESETQAIKFPQSDFRTQERQNYDCATFDLFFPAAVWSIFRPNAGHLIDDERGVARGCAHTPSLDGGEETSASLTIAHEMYTLDNGLRVILSEDHATPYAHVEVWYQVGSKDERKGRSGFAHLFEHLMFQGSEHADGEYFAPFKPMEPASTAPPTAIERITSKRFLPCPRASALDGGRPDGSPPPSAHPRKIDNQREVVRNERRQNYEMRPYAVAQKAISEAIILRDIPTDTSRLGVMKISKLLRSTMSKASSGSGMVQTTQHWWLLGTLTQCRQKLGLKSSSVGSPRSK